MDVKPAVLRPVVKPEEFRLVCPVDTAELESRVHMLSEAAWNAEDARKENRFSVFHHTRHIVARFIPGNGDPLAFYSTPFWSVLQPVVRPILDRAAESFGFREPEFPKVMLARLAAGAVIDRHVDGAGSNLLTHKVHVPLTTNDGVWFEVGDGRFRLVKGFAWELNNIRPHAVRNDGESDRIHLIFEIMDLAGSEGSAEPA